MQYDFFLSYSHHDAEIAAFLVSKLKSAGFECFMAEAEVRPSQKWSPRIREAIVNSNSLLALVTPRSKENLWVAAEAGAAWVLNKQIIPVLMFTDPNDLIEPIKEWQSYPVETPTQIDKFIDKLKHENSEVSIEESMQHPRGEDFNESDNWDRLTKIGDWLYSQDEKCFVGGGSFNYLLSADKYGNTDYQIETVLSFREIENSIGRINSGIVLGWEDASTNPTYHHLMFNGQEFIMEAIGQNGGGEMDFHHIQRHKFILKLNKEYKFRIKVMKNSLVLDVGGDSTYKVAFGRKIVGRVGLRPWRSEIKCKQFKVSSI